MKVRMQPSALPRKIMLMLMMLIMNMRVRMRQFLMRVLVLMLFGQVQPDTYTH